MDRSKYCTLSRVVRYGFMFSDYMCSDLDLDMTPGTHVPKDTNCGVTLSTTRSFQDESHSDGESLFSFTSASEATNLERPRRRCNAGIPINQTYSGRGAYPTSSRASIAEFNDTIDLADCISERNPWAERTKIAAREPHPETFNFDNVTQTPSMLDLTSDSICSSSTSRTGRFAAIVAARAQMCVHDDDPVYRSANSANTSIRSSGRGRLFN